MTDRRAAFGSAMVSLFVAAFGLVAVVFLSSTSVLAHCDGLDGPVVTAAQAALQSGNVNRVLIWVRPQEADEIKRTFEETLAVRKLNPQAQALADRYFFETLVRVDLGPAIPAADKAIVSGTDEAVIKLLTDKVREGIRAHFHEVVEKKRFATSDVAAGREYVEAYVAYIHYIERLYESAERSSQGHYPDTD